MSGGRSATSFKEEYAKQDFVNAPQHDQLYSSWGEMVRRMGRKFNTKMPPSAIG